MEGDGAAPSFDTIAAISSPIGEGAIALVRMSGPLAFDIADSVFEAKQRPSETETRRQAFGRLVEDGALVDEVLLSVHRGPQTYTGEDVVEISCHGGILVTRRVLELLLKRGARSAGPGEFTQRAFLNGRMDLTQAEAVMDVISAQTSLALRAATEQLEGRLGTRVRELREQLLEVVAHVEAYIDFPDEDIDPQTGETLVRAVTQVQVALDELLATADQGRVLRQGVRTVIFGEPNVGKSSLLNMLLGFERAIVSETAGTTRDTIEETINVRGVPVRLVDTAGVRQADDAVEAEGVERARKMAASADLVLRLFDGSQPRRDAPESASSRELRVLNKADLDEDPSWNGVAGLRVSSRTGEGLAALAEGIFNVVMQGGIDAGGSMVAINARHQQCLREARAFCRAAVAALEDKASPEFVALELRAAMEAVGDVVGRVDSEEVLGKIFATFCIGK